MPTQRRGLVAGALDHGDIQSDQGFLERLRPGRRLTIRRVLFQKKKARHRLQRHPTNLRRESLILTHGEIPVGHAPRQRRALLIRDGNQRLLQRRIEALLGAVAGADEGRQPAQLKELAHHPNPGSALQGDAEVRRQHPLILETSVDDTRTLRHARCAGCSGRTEAHPLGDPKKSRSC